MTSISDSEISSVIYRSCLFLDEEKFSEYIGLCSENFFYRIKVYSPELGKEMIWLEQEREELGKLLEGVKNHLRHSGRLFRHATVYSIERNEGGRTANVVTSVNVTHTGKDGVSRVFAIGRYYDKIDLSGDSPLLQSREVVLETRDLGSGSHMPM